MEKMTPKEFVKWVYPAACKASDISPIFVTAQAALESGWGEKRIGNFNLFGITKGKVWNGKTILVTTHEFFDSSDVKFYPPEEIISKQYIPKCGNWRYTVKRLFRDYSSLESALADHVRILSSHQYIDAWAYRKSPEKFVEKIQDNINGRYATNQDYVKTMLNIIVLVKRFI